MNSFKLVQQGVSPPWGTPLGSFRGVTAYSNKGGSREYGTYGWKFECVEYVNRFYVQALEHHNMRGTGNANQYFPTADQRGLHQCERASFCDARARRHSVLNKPFSHHRPWPSSDGPRWWHRTTSGMIVSG